MKKVVGKETEKLLPLVEEMGKRKRRWNGNVTDISPGPPGKRWTVLSI